MLVVLLLLPISLAVDDMSLTTMVTVAVVAARRQWQWWLGRRWTAIGGESGRQQER
jgi:hypothetical protein